MISLASSLTPARKVQSIPINPMKLVFFGCLLLVSPLMISCGANINGEPATACHRSSMTSTKDGADLDLKIQICNAQTGRMIATHSVTGERYSGQFAKLSTTTTGVVTNAFGMPTGSVITGGNSYTIKGVLKGSKGTIISISIDMVAEQYIQDHGVGTATDNKGGSYQVVATSNIALVPTSQLASNSLPPKS